MHFWETEEPHVHLVWSKAIPHSVVLLRVCTCRHAHVHTRLCDASRTWICISFVQVDVQKSREGGSRAKTTAQRHQLITVFHTGHREARNPTVLQLELGGLWPLVVSRSQLCLCLNFPLVPWGCGQTLHVADAWVLIKASLPRWVQANLQFLAVLTDEHMLPAQQLSSALWAPRGIVHFYHWSWLCAWGLAQCLVHSKHSIKIGWVSEWTNKFSSFGFKKKKSWSKKPTAKTLASFSPWAKLALNGVGLLWVHLTWKISIQDHVLQRGH